MLHTAFQNQGIAPGVLMGLRTPNDPVPAGERAFILASTQKAVMEGGTPIKIGNFAKQKEVTK